MKNFKNISLFILSIFCMTFLSFEALAATKTITNVKIYVNSDLEVNDNIKDISVSEGNTGDDINVYLTDESKYSIDSVSLSNISNKSLKIGDELKVKVRLIPEENNNITYKFTGSYSKSNVHIVGGEYVSTSKLNGALIVTFKLKGIKGRYDSPDNVGFSSKLGKATWEAPANSTGYYDILVYKGDNQIAAIRDYNGTSINLYPYMTSKGRYSFKVRTVAHTAEQKKYGTNSEYERSEDLYIEADEVSDGSGKYEPNSSSASGPASNNSSNNESIIKVGWIKDDSYWYYRFPDGSYKKNAWELISGKWYLFDNAGRMLTAWQKTNNTYYYLDKNNGDMQTGWISDGGNWYYLSESGNNIGAMLTNTWVRSSDNKLYYLTNTGAMARYWTNIGNNWYYFYQDGHLAINEVIDTFRVNEQGIWVK